MSNTADKLARGLGFTLIELLVVITIIVVLLALLVPAMDQAIYQSELAICTARLRSHASTMVVYAMDHQRKYLYRGSSKPGTFAWRPDYIALTTETDKTLDDRPLMRPYMAINKMAACPLVEEVDMDGFPPTDDAPTAVLIYNSYDRWYGFQYTGQKGMFKIGDKLGWADLDGKRYSFNAVISDIDCENFSDNWTNSAHPDRDGFLALTTEPNGINPFVQAKSCFSYWGRWGTAPARGKIDRNFAFDDGSAQTYKDVEIDDERFEAVGGYNTTTAAQTSVVRNWLPKQ